MAVSVLTPSYNYERFLEDNLRSVAAQRPRVEHVVVDDGSQDGSRELLQAWSVSLTSYKEQENAGLSATLNTCLRAATGEWIGWLNADDFYLPWTSQVLEQEGRGPYDVIYGDSVFVDERGCLTRLAPEHWFSPRVLRGYGPFLAPPAMFVRRGALDGYRFDTSLIKLMDWDLYLHLWESGARFRYIPVTLGAFRRHSDQQSNRATPEAETMRVRCRYSLPNSGSMAARGYYRYGQIEHALLKSLNGGYRRQAAVRRTRGLDLRWWLPQNGHHQASYRRLLVKEDGFSSFS